MSNPDTPLPLAALEAAYRHLRALRKAGLPADQRTARDRMAAAVLRPGDAAVVVGTGADPHTRILADLLRGPGGVVHAMETEASDLAAQVAVPAYRHVLLRQAERPASIRLPRLLARLPRLPWLRLAIAPTTPATLDAAATEIARLRPLVSLRDRPATRTEALALFDALTRLALIPFDMFGHALRDQRAFLLAARLRAVNEWVAVPAEQGAPPAALPGTGVDRAAPPRRVLLVPGMAKAGTTFLFDQLAQQGAPFAPSRNKEVNAFVRRALPPRDRYLDLFAAWDPALVLVDASPATLQRGEPGLAERIRAVLAPDAVQVLILLRDPIDALLSHYLHDLKSHVGMPGTHLARPARYSLTDPEIFARYTKPRAATVAGFREVFGAACHGAPMDALFDGRVAALLGAMFGVTVAPFDAARRSNAGGFVPRYIHGGAEGAVLHQDGAAFRVPPGALLFVAEERSELVPAMPEAEAASLLRLGASFTTAASLPRAAFAAVEDDHRAICGILGLPPLIRDHGAEICFAPRPARVSAAVLALLEPA